MKEILKNAIIMTIFCVAAGLGLGAVYGITKEPIAKAQAEALQTALKEVISAETFELADVDSEAIIEAQTAEDIPVEAAKINEVYVAKDASGELAGYAFNVSEMEGYGGEIKFIVGIDKEGAVTGISILTINETAGLGMKAKEASFRDQYVGKVVDKFVVTKTGKTKDDEIDAISAATITSKAMTKGVNTCLIAYRVVGGGADE